MRLDVAKKSGFQEIAEKNGVPFASVLKGYITENFFKQLSVSSYNNVLLLANPERIGKKAYQSAKEGRLLFYYMESERKIAESRLIAGQKMSKELGAVMRDELFPKNNREQIDWRCLRLKYHSGVLFLSMLAVYDEMQIPLEMEVHRFDRTSVASSYIELDCMVLRGGKIPIRIFPAEKILVQNLLEVMDKLELIADMKAFDAIDRILQTQSISGRRIMEAFEEKSKEQPTFQKMLRLDQLKSYEKYAYMKKRWNSFRNNNGKDLDEWEIVLQRILRFVEPIWTAFCENMVFLDDWMPELGRFLM